MAGRVDNDLSARARLARGEPLFGVIQTIPAPALTELAVWSGYDFVILDREHGEVDEAAHLSSLRALSGSSALIGVRVRSADYTNVGRYLDFGADVIVMPDVQSATEAAQFVAAGTAGPRGTRSSSRAVRAVRYGLDTSDQARAPLLWATIESATGVAAVADIAETPGLCGVIVGPSDLSADLGCPYEFTSSSYTRAIAVIEQALQAARLPMGTIVHPGFPVERLLAAGHRLIIVTADVAIVREGLATQLAAARRSLITPKESST
jgi:4-hydroxy-2-oxoheptanedioate aldolase